MRHDMRKSGSQEIISLEEYLDRRQKIKEKESKKNREKQKRAPPGCGQSFTFDYPVPYHPYRKAHLASGDRL